MASDRQLGMASAVGNGVSVVILLVVVAIGGIYQWKRANGRRRW